MTERLQVYRCQLCGNIVHVVHAGAGQLVCCGQPMTYLDEQTADSATEKHVPVIEAVDGGTKVTVGSVPHPMEENHFIQWIELIADGKVYRHYLEPGAPPETVFPVEGGSLTAREYCNLHGHWKA